MKKSISKIENYPPLVASWPLKNRHIQTLYASFFRKQNSYPSYKIESFILSDGDFLDIYYHPSLLPENTQAIAVLFHGLAGSYKSPYIQGISQTLISHNIAPVIMHYRSTSGRDNRYPQTYHSGKSDDALEFLYSLKQRYPKHQLFGIGYSLGGNMLLKLLGEQKEGAPLDAAVAVSAPMDLAICADVIRRGFSKIYQEHLLKDLRASLIQKYEKHPMQKLLDLKKQDVKKLQSFWEFDAAYTAKIHGFDSVDDYYQKCSSKQFLKNITIPTLIIHAKDDPFMSPEVIPKQSEISSDITLEITEFGGHVGFIGGSLFQPSYWLEKRIPPFLLKYLSCNQHQKHS